MRNSICIGVAIHTKLKILQSAKQVDTPNHLYFYFAEMRRNYHWRIRTVIALFTTTTEKKLWLDILHSSLRGMQFIL